MKPVCIITGVGPGTGSALVRRFAQDYQVAMIARDRERLLAISEEVPDTRAWSCNVADAEAVITLIDDFLAQSDTYPLDG